MQNTLFEATPEGILPGFRFHPTDEELVGFYLHRKVQRKALPFEVITQLDIYKYDPWELPKMAVSGENVWYFFCLRDQKYRNSTRPNRVTKGGFWKATGPDRAIYTQDLSKCIGLKKSLVFYTGKAAKGIKTDWVMHEFRLPVLGGTNSHSIAKDPSKKRPQVFEESWAVCRIFKKRSMAKKGMSSSWTAPAGVYSTYTHSEEGSSIATEDMKNNVNSVTGLSYEALLQSNRISAASPPLDCLSFLNTNAFINNTQSQESPCSSTLRSSSTWDLSALVDIPVFRTCNS